MSRTHYRAGDELELDEDVELGDEVELGDDVELGDEELLDAGALRSPDVDEFERGVVVFGVLVESGVVEEGRLEELELDELGELLDDELGEVVDESELDVLVEVRVESWFGVDGYMLLSRLRVPALLAVRFEPLGVLVEELRSVLLEVALLVP